MKKIITTIVTGLVLFSSINVFAGAKVSSQSVIVDGKDTGVKGYIINDNNYFKLRDIAALLEGKEAGFNVTYDKDRAAVMIESKTGYKKTDEDLIPLKDSDSEIKKSKHNIFVNGVRQALSAYSIEGYNYFQLRELGKAIGFNVSYDEKDNKVLIDSKAINPQSIVNNQKEVKILEYATSSDEKTLDIIKDPLLDINMFFENINNNILATDSEGQIQGQPIYVKSEGIVEVIPASTKFVGKLTYKPYIRITQAKKTEIFPYQDKFEVAKTLASKGFDSTSEFEISLGAKSEDHFVKYSTFNYK